MTSCLNRKCCLSILFLILHYSVLIKAQCGIDDIICNNGKCINNKYVCDYNDDCGDDSDESPFQCSNEYICTYSNILNITDLTHNKYGRDLSVDDAEAVINIANTIQNLGINVQDGLILISLLFANVVTSIFIITGLYLYQTNIGFKEINVNYVVFLIITLQMLLVTSINGFEGGVISCMLRLGSFYSFQSISWVDVMVYILCAILWFIWCKHSCTAKCCGCKYFVVCCIFVFPICIGFTFPPRGFVYMRLVSCLLVYSGIQMALPLIWFLLVTKGNFTCCNRRTNICPIKSKCGIISFLIILLIVICFIQFYILYKYVSGSLLWYNCHYVSGSLLWYNPLYLLISVLLLFSEVRYPILLYNIIIAIIYIIGSYNNDICLYVINIHYIIHSLMIPLYIILIFFIIKELKQWKFHLISMYLASFDLVTDIVVIYYFIYTQNYIFAGLQIIFVLLGQIVGSCSNNLSVNDEYDKLTTKDKLISFLGFGETWFLINSWSETNNNHIKYHILNKKHKVWELMFESFPTVTLQIYASLVINEKSSVAILSSIIISSFSITFNAFQYLTTLTQIKQHENENENEIELGTIENENKNKMFEKERTPSLQSMVSTVIEKKFGRNVVENKKLYINLYAFMVSDFYIRSIPLIIFISSIPCEYGDIFCIPRIIGFILLFGSLIIFEYIMNKRMRIKTYQSILFIIQIFSISMLSSFYNLLSSLNILQNDKFFGKSVEFKSFLFEHKIRIVLSVLINIINISLFSVNPFDKNMYMLGLIIAYGIFLVLNLFTMKYIKYHNQTFSMSNSLQKPLLTELMGII